MTTRHAKYVQSKRGSIPNRIEYDLLMAIALDTGEMDEPVVTGYTELSQKAGCHRNSVGAHIKRLREAGWLKVGGTDQKRVYYLEGIMDEEIEAQGIMDNLERRVTETRHSVQRGIVMVSELESSQIVLEVAQRLSQIAAELSQIVTILATVTNEPSQRPEGHCDGSAPNSVDHSIYNNINNNYYDPTVTNIDTRDCALEGVTLFQQLTSLFPPHDSTDAFKDHWLQPMTAIVTHSRWDMELVERRIREAIKIARGDNPQKKRYPIASPKSILTIALNWEPGQEQLIPYNPVRMVQI